MALGRLSMLHFLSFSVLRLLYFRFQSHAPMIVHPSCVLFKASHRRGRVTYFLRLHLYTTTFARTSSSAPLFSLVYHRTMVWLRMMIRFGAKNDVNVKWDVSPSVIGLDLFSQVHYRACGRSPTTSYFEPRMVGPCRVSHSHEARLPPISAYKHHLATIPS